MDLDPVLVGVVRRLRPDDTVVEIDVATVSAGRPRRYAAIVMQATDEGLAAVAGSSFERRVVLITGHRSSVDVGSHAGPVLRRPVEPSELRAALAGVAPGRTVARLRHRLLDATTSTSTDGAFAVARVGAVTAASALTLSNPAVEISALVVVGLMIWSVVRVGLRGSTTPLVTMDVLLAVGAVVLSGGTGSPFLLLAAVAAAEVGYAFRPFVAVTTVTIATIVGLVPLIVQMARGEVQAIELVAWVTLIPLASAIGLLGSRMRQSGEGGGLRALTEVHRTLDRLARQAQGVAGTLALSSVADRLLTSLRRELGAVAAALLVGDPPIRSVLAANGLSAPAPSRVVMQDSRVASLPDDLRQLLPSGEIECVAMHLWGLERGVIVVVMPRSRVSREASGRLRELAREAAVAIDNARLFEGVRELTVDAERRRLARDLHDGVIQSLVHVGFELDLVRQGLDDPAAAEVARLRGVVGQTVDEVRATVNNMRSVQLSAGLATALGTLARDYRRSDLVITTDLDPVEDLAPEVELQFFRIAQEAVSNAVHHASPSTVDIRLWTTEDRGVHLRIQDDGVGLPPQQRSTADPSRGVGLRAMQERVDLLGARLRLEPREAGGTSVQVDLPGEGMGS